jgi:2-polyprenyl-3-methyl-5-hydroxy-6-metoxy-1,4-benzoquinol methylase
MKHGVDGYYKQFASTYKNPHEEQITKFYIKHIFPILSDIQSILDIACGDGLISRLVHKYNPYIMIHGTDPYISNIYTTYKFSFEDIALGKITKTYDCMVCCYAFHLIDNEWKYDFLTHLSLITKKFIIITPSKKINTDHPLWKTSITLREDKITLIVLEIKN